jgi:selenocysteine-specific elongation factor
MASLNGLVVGTAGHIDHGKTSLVYALTGIDTDRLKEEKQRGISIDLGFAQMTLPDGRALSFVDVPGHERFIRNMLAGAAGMEAVLLIVAANESVMPQTEEHFEICRLLAMRHGIIVLTKCDLATPEQILQTRTDVQRLVAGSFLAHASVVEFSAVTHAGLDELKYRLAMIASQQTGRDRKGLMRMPIDRAFAVKGFGSVATGTLLSGSVNVGDVLEIHPQRNRVRVRGLQARHAPVDRALAGQRLAVNLAGVDHQDVKRGHILISPDSLAASQVLDVDLHWLEADAWPSPQELFVLHAGTAETSVKVRLHQNGAQKPRFARLRLKHGLMVVPGDRFVIRRPSPAKTVGGGVVVDALPPRRIGRGKALARLEALADAPLGRRIEFLLEEAPAGRSIADLIRMTGSSGIQVREAISESKTIVMGGDERAVTRAWIDSKRQALLTWLRDFHKSNPNAPGAPLAAARLGLDASLASLILKEFAAIRVQGETVALAGHRAEFSLSDQAAMQKMEQTFRVAGFKPPSATEAMATAGVDAKRARTLLESMVKNNRLVRLPDDLIFHVDVITHIRTSLTQHKGRKFSVAEFKTWTNISRKFAIPLLEYLDQQRVTRREGEVRVVL